MVIYGSRGPNPEQVTAYGVPFWMAYVSATLLMTAVSLLYRFADFITSLGGTEFHLGCIVGVGMVGSLVTRLALGSWIDRYGSKVIWLSSTGLFAVTCFAHLFIASYTGVAIYLLRVLYCCTVSGHYGASITFIASRVPAKRIGELVGMLGTASFLGTVAGTVLGDFLLGSTAATRPRLVMMFVAAGALGILSYPFAWLATRVEVRPIPAHRPFLLGVLRQHYPGAVLLVGVATGIGLNLPSVFLAPYAAALDIPRISLFFTVCSITVVVARLLTRRWPERLGNQAVIVLGISSTVASLLLFLPVHAEWHLVLPGIGFGFSSAILFPSVVAAGSMAFPPQHRGLGTLLVLAAFDLGQLIGVPVAGILLQFSPVVGLMPYPTLFLTMASLLALVGVWYVAFCRLRSASQRSRNEYNKNWSGCCPTCSQSRGF